ncbi:MAG: fructose-6-phosphate aldolase [Clostridiales bacterium]|nr:fructose-6-phosphate aldolase [Clostridiales bacterium]
MKLIIDNADIKTIQEIYDVYPVDGVTTNPSILAKSGRPPYETLREIRKFIGEGAELHVQVIASDPTDMREEAHRILDELGKDTFIKVPVTTAGLKAIRLLHNEGIRVTATAVYTQMQAFLAAKAGAGYAAPYVNRIDNLGADGIRTAKDIHDIFQKNGFHTEVLAASFKNSQQVLELCKYGIGAVTISPDVMENLIKNDSVRMAVEAFVRDFEMLCGAGKTMKNCQ